MIDGLALGETTPGPLIMVVAFVGFVGGWTHAGARRRTRCSLGAALAAVRGHLVHLPAVVPLHPRRRAAGRVHAWQAEVHRAADGHHGRGGRRHREPGAVLPGAHRAAGTRAGRIDWLALGIAALAAVALLRFKVGVIPVILGCAPARVVRCVCLPDARRYASRMNILITGGSGFLGARLARTLLQQGSLSLNGGSARDITSVTLTDRAPPPPTCRPIRACASSAAICSSWPRRARCQRPAPMPCSISQPRSAANAKPTSTSACAATSPRRTRCWKPAAPSAAVRWWCSPVHWRCSASSPASRCPS